MLLITKFFFFFSFSLNRAFALQWLFTTVRLSNSVTLHSLMVLYCRTIIKSQIIKFIIWPYLIKKIMNGYSKHVKRFCMVTYSCGSQKRFLWVPIVIHYVKYGDILLYTTLSLFYQTQSKEILFL